MVLTTAGAPPLGVNWQAVITAYLSLLTEPGIGTAITPTAKLNVAALPSIGMQPPALLNLLTEPMIGVDGGSKEAAAVRVGTSPSIGLGSVQTAVLNLSTTPNVGATGVPIDAGTLNLTITPTIGLTGTTPVGYLGVGAGTAGTTVSFTDTIPVGTNCTLIWAVTAFPAANPTVSATIGSTAATLIDTVSAGIASNYAYLHCFSVLNPPTGSQTITFTGANMQSIAMTTVHYDNVSSVGSPIALGNQTGQPSLTATSTNADNRYVCAFGYRENASTSGNTFSGYNQTQRYLINGSSVNFPLVIGDALGNGASLTFSVTRSGTTYGWGGILTPLIR